MNGKDTQVCLDGYDAKVTLCGPVVLGSFTPVDGKITLRAVISGTNPQTVGERCLVGLDCIILD